MNKQDLEAYLKDLFAVFVPYVLTEDEKKIVTRDLQTFIIQKLFRKRFRKQKVFPNAIADITNKVALSLKEYRPLHFTVPFGGYKHFWNPSHPEPDWAELFTMKFLTEWVSPILTVHEPGVIIEYISEDLILPRMNNYPEEALENYAKSFRLLLDSYKKYIPKNLDIRFFRVGDKYDKEKIVKEVEKMLPESWRKWETYSQEQKDIELKRSKRSVMWKGREDLTGLSDEAKQKRMIESRLIELAYYSVEAKPEFLGNYFMEDNHVGICFSYGLSPDNSDHWLTLGSTYASTVDYWIGRGILEERDGNFIPRIASKEQYHKIKESLKTVETHFDLLSLKNYQSIEIIDEKDWEKGMDI